jgi:hypothetical protein
VKKWMTVDYQTVLKVIIKNGILSWLVTKTNSLFMYLCITFAVELHQKISLLFVLFISETKKIRQPRLLKKEKLMFCKSVTVLGK